MICHTTCLVKRRSITCAATERKTHTAGPAKTSVLAWAAMFIQWSPMGFPRFLSLYNIRTALLIFVLVPFLLVMVISAGFSLHRLEKAAATGMQDDIELIARSIHRPLSHALEHNLQLTLRRTVSSAGEIGRVYAAYMCDLAGKHTLRERVLFLHRNSRYGDMK